MFGIVWLYIKKMKKNTMICILGIAISMMMIFSLIQIGESVVISYKNMILAKSPFDLRIEDLNRAAAGEIREFYQEEYQVIVNNYAAIACEAGREAYYVLGVEGEWKTLFAVEILEGREPGGAHEICVPKSYAEGKNISVGDEITLTLRMKSYAEDQQAAFQVVGIVADPPVYDQMSYMFVPLSTAGDEEYIIYLLIDEMNFPDDEVVKVIGELYGKYGLEFMKERICLNEDKADLCLDKGAFYGLRRGMAGITIFVLIIMTFFIYYMMRINFQSKNWQYGVLCAIGMNRRNMGKMIAYELLVYGSIGSVLGCLLGLAVNRLIASKIITPFVGAYVYNISISIPMMLYVLGAIAVSMVSVYGVIMWENRKKMPIELITNAEKNRKFKKISLKNLIWDLVVNNSFRSKKNSRALILTMFLAFLFVIVLGNAGASVSFDMDKSVMSFSDSEVSLFVGNLDTMESGFQKEVVEGLREEADAIYCQGVAYDMDIMQGIRIRVYDTALMEKLRNANHLKKDAQVVAVCGEDWQFEGKALTGEIEDGKEFELQVDAVIPVGWTDLTGRYLPGESVIISEKKYRELTGREPVWHDILISGENVPLDTLQHTLGPGDYSCMNFDGALADMTKQLAAMMILVSYMLLAVVLLAIFSISSVVRENFEHRRKEIGMLMAVGANAGQVTRMLMGELLVLALISAAIASVAAVPFSTYVYSVINDRVGMRFQGYLLGLPSVMILCSAVALVNIRQGMRQQIVNLIRNEE